MSGRSRINFLSDDVLFRIPDFSISAFQEVIEREAVIFARKTENKEEESETRNHVAAKVEERVVQKMAECDDDEDHAERD